MIRSMYSGVAGLKVHQTKMDVIGNNIANVNTTGYKSQSINFSDLMYQNTQRASGATETTGGVNAKQVGLGALSASITTAIEQQGATQTTNNPFDLQITGDSFFIVNDGEGNKYTRDGSFYVDGAGNLATQANGYYVQGWSAVYDADTKEYTVNKNGGVGQLSIMNAENLTYEPEATSEAVLSGNIDKNDKDVTGSEGKTVALEFYDSLGYLYTAKFSVKDVADNEHNYTMELTDVTDANGVSIVPEGGSVSDYFAFGEQGNETVTLRYNASTGKYAGYDGTDYDEDNTATRTVQLTPTDTARTNGFVDVNVDIGSTTNFNTESKSTLQLNKGDLQTNGAGRRVGTMSGVVISQDGSIHATYTNGQTKLLGQIAVAEFANASGLEKMGENLYGSSLNSGDPQIMDVSLDGGKISTGVLEMSNVDLSNEFTNMITAQRGFQANSRIITVSDTLLEELTNLKR